MYHYIKDAASSLQHMSFLIFAIVKHDEVNVVVKTIYTVNARLRTHVTPKFSSKLIGVYISSVILFIKVLSLCLILPAIDIVYMSIVCLSDLSLLSFVLASVSLLQALISLMRRVKVGTEWVLKRRDFRNGFRLKDLAELRLALCTAADAFASYLAPNALLLTALTLAKMTIRAKLVIDHFSSVNVNQYALLFECSVMTFNFVLLITVINATEAIKNEVKDFNTLLFQMMIDDKSAELSNNETLKLHISLNREVVFTACGLFPLDYTLIHSMVAAATTYLVILIQFSSADPEINPFINGTLSTSTNDTLNTIH
ncbi:putative gustatory receptor 28b [Cimex lectularius]|uniref:Gustatory receptor n=1 Tax=Cimex lectularius TaxID=79782 RepID=A0A8I6RLU1_CIMLE|nr:putative gustatory receptor 28b [Cimex lectularius]